MHWVDRGDEPTDLAEIRDNFTTRWIDHYRRSIGDKPPNDHRWTQFIEDLRKVFSELCGYCERRPRGQVDHFKPKSKFPELVYEWDNWIFSCAECNSSKQAKWPKWGYVDPCARSRQARPETYFESDLLTGQILPQSGLSQRRSRKAWQTIYDLNLNGPHHLKNRIGRIELLTLLVLSASSDDEFQNFVDGLAAIDLELPSLTRAFLESSGYTGGW